MDDGPSPRMVRELIGRPARSCDSTTCEFREAPLLRSISFLARACGVSNGRFSSCAFTHLRVSLTSSKRDTSCNRGSNFLQISPSSAPANLLKVAAFMSCLALCSVGMSFPDVRSKGLTRLKLRNTTTPGTGARRTFGS